MSLLIDNQLPAALDRYLSSIGWPAVHVSDLGLERADDQAIWNYAAANKLVIVTKDQDFRSLAASQGRIPPQVIWVRLGNCRRQALVDAFTREASDLRHKLASGLSVVELC